MNEAFWSGRRVLVTGQTGFKGSWLCLWLLRAGARVAGVARALPTRPALFELARIGEDVASLDADVRHLEDVVAAVERHRPEVVFHLAAQPLVRAGFADPVATYGTNVMGTVNVLEAARRAAHVRVVVVVTTDKVYEHRGQQAAHREDDPLGGADPYASSKACAELVASAYRHSLTRGGPAIATARAGNVIGGGDWARDRLVPDLIRGAVERQVVRIRNPDAIRPWQHVLNPLDGYLMLAERLWDEPDHARAWNFGPGAVDERPVSQVADLLAALWGEGLAWERDPRDHPREAPTLRIDSSLARARLGWRPGWDLDRALRTIVDFARAQLAGADLRDVMLEQIAAYEADARAVGSAPAELGY